MKQIIFIDSDVILDVVFKREPFFSDSQTLLTLAETNIVKANTSSLILANCYYIISKHIGIKVAQHTIGKLREIINILPLTNKEIGESLNSEFKDFEDGVEYYIALNHGIEILITRDVKHYKYADITTFTPAQFINLEHIKQLYKS